MTSYGQTWGTFLFAFLSLSVGAYEPATNYFSTSVEQADIGITGETWTPIGWQTNQDSYRLERYRELDPTPYSENSRRSDSRFSAGSTNETYCSLLAGDQPLVHSVLTNQVYFDGIVSFSGYEDAPTNHPADAHIRLWMQTLDVEVDPEKIGCTNLFCSVGPHWPRRQINTMILGTYAPNRPYRVTIRSLGNILKDWYGEKQEGFLIYIDGQLVRHTRYSLDSSGIIDSAYAYCTNLTLFTSMRMVDTRPVPTNYCVGSVGYYGQGLLDDVCLSAVAPDIAPLRSSFDLLVAPGTHLSAVIGPDGLLQPPYHALVGNQIRVFVAPDPYYIYTRTDPIVLDVTGASRLNLLPGTVPYLEKAAASIRRAGFADQYVGETNVYKRIFGPDRITQTGDIVDFPIDWLDVYVDDIRYDDWAYYMHSNTTVAVTAPYAKTITVDEFFYDPKSSRCCCYFDNGIGISRDEQWHVVLNSGASADSGSGIAGRIPGGSERETRYVIEGDAFLYDDLSIGARPTILPGEDCGALFKADTFWYDEGSEYVISLLGNGRFVTKTVLSTNIFWTSTNRRIQVTQDAEGWYTYSSVPTNAVTASSVVSASFQEATSARSSTPVADHRRRVEAVRERIRSRKDQP